MLLIADPAAIDAALTAARPPTSRSSDAATAANWQAMAELAEKHGCPLADRAPRAATSTPWPSSPSRCAAPGSKTSSSTPAPRAWPATSPPSPSCAAWPSRRTSARWAIPILADGARELAVAGELARAAQAIAKYAGVIVLDTFDPALVYPLLTLRQNIYTDPQKPIQVEPKLYEIGAPGPDSPLLITTNFSLTYFSVSGEVEGSGTPAWLLVADADGQSVLTGWAAGKFDAEKIAKTVKGSGIGDTLSHKKLVIPGHVAGLSGEVEEELPGWQIMVGPRDAVDIPSYLKNVWSA